jgi:hypothetical protein
MPPRPHSSIPLRSSQEFDRNVQHQQQPYSSRRDSSYSQKSWNPPPPQRSPTQERYRDYPPRGRDSRDYRDDDGYGREYDDEEDGGGGGGHDIYAGESGALGVGG